MTYEQREKEIHPKNNHNCRKIITSQRRKINGFILLSNYKLKIKSNCPINFKQKQYLSVGENDFIFTTYTLTHSVLLFFITSCSINFYCLIYNMHSFQFSYMFFFVSFSTRQFRVLNTKFSLLFTRSLS